MTIAEQTVRLQLPLPRDLLPNRRSGAHWGPHAGNIKQWRYWAMMATADHTMRREWGGRWPAARLDIEWRCAGKQPDDDNIIAACKPIRDGIADTGIVADDTHITTGTVRIVRVTRADEGLVLTLTRMEDTSA